MAEALTGVPFSVQFTKAKPGFGVAITVTVVPVWYTPSPLVEPP